MPKALAIFNKILIFSLTFLCFTCSTQSPADLIIIGKIYSVNPEQPWAEAVAVRNGRITKVSTEKETARLKGKDTKLLRIEEGLVLPGLIDAHGHLLSLGRSLSELNLMGTVSKEEIQTKVLEKQKWIQPGSWITGRGWDQNDWQVKKFPTWRDLSGSENNPVYLRRVDGHAVWANKKVLELGKITKETPDPPGGKIIRDQNGNPTGVFVDNAMNLILPLIPQPSWEEKLEWAKKAIKECNRLGLVGVHDAGADSIILEVYQHLLEDGKLTLRLYALLSDDDTLYLKKRFKQGPQNQTDGFLILRSVKLYADGALGSRGAALLEPYSDEPSHKGLLVSQPEYLYQITKEAVSHGFQVCTHAIGDAGNRAILNVYGKILNELPENDYRLRIEHAQVISLDDIPRFVKLKVIPSMQPTHATSDMYWAEERVGPERIKGAYAWRKLLDQGSRIACGSDFPVESPNPLWGIYSAITRQDHKGWPENGWHPEERMTIEEAIRGFTLDAAYAEFADSLRGSIEEGKLADFTVLDKDILGISPKEILTTRVLYTIVGGKVVYPAGSEN